MDSDGGRGVVGCRASAPHRARCDKQRGLGCRADGALRAWPAGV